MTTNKATRIQDNIFYSTLKRNDIYLDEDTEEFYTQVSVVAIITALFTLGLIAYSI